MNNDNLKRVYQTLIDNGYTPPQYEQFEKEMEDDNNLQGVYNTLKNEGYTPPSYDVFKSDMGFGATETQQPAAKDTAAVAEPATDETQIPSVTAEKTPGSYAWRLNVVNQPGKNPYQSRTYGSVYDEIISDYGKNLAKADGDPFAEARASIIQAGITDDTKPEEAESLALNIRHGYANKYAGNASKEMVSALPDQVPNVDSLIDGLWYTRDMQNRVNHEASRLGLRKENYVNYYMKPQLAKALSDRYGYDVESAKRIAGRLLSQDEHTNEVIRQNEAMNVVSQYAAPIIEGEFKKIQEAADREAAPTMLNLNGTPEQKFLASVKNWQATDPETVWQNLKPMFDNMGSWMSIVGNEQLFNQISQMAEAEQIPVNAYIDKYVIPSYANAVQKEFERIAVEREMPKDTYEYIVKKMGESLIGNIGKWMLASEARRRAQGEAMQLTDTGQGEYKPGFGAKVAGGAAAMLPDMVMPFGGPFGFTAKLATKPLGGVAQLLITSGTRPLLARITQASLSGSASLGAFEGLKGAIEGGITPTGYEHLLAEDKRSAGDILLDVLKGGFERGIPSAVTGATMIGGPIGQKISNGRGLLANLAGWGTQVGVDAGLATAINIPKVVSGAITADDLKDEFFENIGTFAALGLHSKGKEFANLASGGRSINGVEFTKPEIESIEDRYLMPLRDVINEIDEVQSKRSLITKSRLGIDEAQEKRDAITEVGTEIFNDMLYSYGVPADLKVKVCEAFNLPVPENALKPKVLKTTDKVVSDVVSEGFDNKVNQDYNKPGGVLDKLKKGESLSDYELTLRLLIQDNKRYNEIGEKLQAGNQLTEDEMAFVNQYNSRIDSIQAKMFSQELDRMASDFEKRNDLKKGTIKRMLADLKAGKGVEDAYMLDKFESELNEYSKILDEVKNARSQENVTESPIDEAIDIPTETPTSEAAVETPDTTAGAETVIEPATADEAAPQMDRSELADKLTNGKTGTIMEVMLADGRKAYVIDGVLSNDYGRVTLADENGDVITMTDGNGYTIDRLPADLLARDEAGNIIMNEQTVGEFLGTPENAATQAPAVKENLTTEQPAMSRIPVTDGVHQFEQAKPEDTLAALRESLDTPEELAETIDEQISDLTNELQQLTEAPKGKNKKVLTMDEKLQKKSAIKELQKRIDYWNSVKELLNANEVKPEEPITEQPVTDGETITEPAAEPVAEPVVEPSAKISAEPEQPISETPSEPIQPTKNAKQVVYETTVNNNVGKRYEITDKKGVRSEITIDGISEDGKVMITRQDIDKQGKPLGQPRHQSVSIDRMGKALIEGSMTPAKTTDDKLRIAFKNRRAMQNLINVLNETEAADLYSAYLDGDADRVSELFNELSETHKEDMVLQERDNRNSNIEKIMSGPGNREDKLRRVRDQYKGYPDAEVMLSDEAMQPTTLEEYIAEIHSRVPTKGEGPIAYNSYETADGHKIVGLQDETGYGTKSGADTKGFKPWLAPKGKGMSLIKYAEQVHSQLPEAVQEQYSDQDVRNALLEVFGGAERPSDIPLMNIRRGIIQAEQAARLMEDMVIDGNISYQKVHQRFADRLEQALMQTNENPSDGQKKAGNYKKGHLSFGGYHYTVENPAGSVRRGTDANGNPWEIEMNNTYGYILGKKGKDGDHLDMFINDKADLDNWDGTVYVVDQVDPETGKFDEHKVMYGFGSEAEARDAYLSNYSRGWQGLGKITGVDKATFDKWLDSSDRKQKEFADHSIVKHKLESQVKNFDSALEKLDERGISIDDPELLKAYGLRNVILSRTGDHVSLTHFIANEPGQGSGTRFMEDLARLADEKGWTLALTPDTSFGARSMSALKRFYNRFGFKPNKGRYTDFETNESMVRRPKEWTPDAPEYQEQVLRDVIIDHLRESGVEVSTNLKEGQQILDRYNGEANLSKAQKRALETAVPEDGSSFKATVISSADGAKILNNLETLVNKSENLTRGQKKSFIKDVAVALGAEHKGSGSQYATFETKNGSIVTIRLADHNATVSGFDHNDVDNGISIVISRKPNTGITNDGEAHIVEFFYPDKVLRNAENESYADIVRSIQQSLYSGEYQDTTGLAEREEVNADQIRQHKVYHGTGAEFDAFDHSHMGEGEGYQTYGYGTYVTEVPAIAQGYAEKGARSKYRRMNPGYGDNEVLYKGEKVDLQSVNPTKMAYDLISSEGTVKKAINTAERLKGLAEDPEMQQKWQACIDILKDSKKSDFKARMADLEGQRYVYDVEIPDDNGENYLDYELKPTDKQVHNIVSQLYKLHMDDIVKEHRIATMIRNANSIGNIIDVLHQYIGGKATAKLLHDAGYVGTKYPTNYMAGGNREGTKNYVIYDENDAKITDTTKFFKTPDGQAYGYTYRGKIYIDPRIATAETPIHEYSHLWAQMKRETSPDEWNSIKQTLLGDKLVEPFIEKVKRDYPELVADGKEDTFIEEVLTQFSGKHGVEKLRKMAEEIKQELGGDAAAETIAQTAIRRVRSILNDFWKGVCNMMGWPYTNAEDVADAVLRDMLNGVDPMRARQQAGDISQQKVETERPTFYSNALKAVEDIRQEKGTPDQWLAMIQKNGGLKAGEDKWLGLSDWLNEQKQAGKSVTKQEVMDYIRKNQIQIEEENYQEINSNNPKLKQFNDEFQDLIIEGEEATGSIYASDWVDWAFEQMVDRYGDDFRDAFDIGEGTGIDSRLTPAVDYYDEPTRAAKYFLGTEDTINSTRLGYTTDGLKNKREIALTVPSIDPYNEHDEIHFGDAGGGRAVAWARFGETTDPDGKRVLVIDEIQSKRHQDAREKGYRKDAPSNAPALVKYETAKKAHNDYLNTLRDKYGRDDVSYGLTEEEQKESSRLWKEAFDARAERNQYMRENSFGPFSNSDVPEAPFEKNWHELAMKRMLRYAAENGFDKIAWTTGAQQAERYDLGKSIDKISVFEPDDFEKEYGEYRNIQIDPTNRHSFFINVDKDGNIMSSGMDELRGKKLSEVLGKELSAKIMESEPAAKIMESEPGLEFAGNNLVIGGEGMKGFYDEILPRFMNKYGKKWGVKVGEIDLPNLEPSAQKMWSIDVTPDMRNSVMQGQPMFQKVSDDHKKAQLDIINSTNPMTDDYHTGIRKVDDIKTFDEAYEEAKKASADGGWDELASYPDITNEMIEEARKTGKIAIYSSYPIKNGVFVTPSEMQAKDYSGGERIYSKQVPLSDVAWINLDEGQYAKVDNQPMFQLVGKQGAAEADRRDEETIRMDNNRIAEEMEKAGKDASAIKLATGWERGKDGQWRYEVPDAKVNILDAYRKAEQAKSNKLNELYKAYDKLNDQYYDLAGKIPSRMDNSYTEEQKAKIRQMRKEREKLFKQMNQARDAYWDYKEDVRNVTNTTLGEILGADNELFKYYPEMKDMQVQFSTIMDPGVAGSQEVGYGIKINADELKRFENNDELNNDNVYGTLLHEIQHAIQETEGFAQGGNLRTATTKQGISEIISQVRRKRNRILQNIDSNRKYLSDEKELELAAMLDGRTIEKERKRLNEELEDWTLEYDQLGAYIQHLEQTGRVTLSDARDLYRRLAGEVEARNVTNRMDLTPEERQQKLAEATEDVSRDNQVVIYPDGESGNPISKEAMNNPMSLDFPSFQRVRKMSPQQLNESIRKKNEERLMEIAEKRAAEEGGIKKPNRAAFEKEAAERYAKDYEAWMQAGGKKKNKPNPFDYTGDAEYRKAYNEYLVEVAKYKPEETLELTKDDVINEREMQTRTPAQKITKSIATTLARDYDGEQASDAVREGVIERRRNIEELSADDSIYINNLREQTDSIAKEISGDRFDGDDAVSRLMNEIEARRSGKQHISGKDIRDALPFIIEAPMRRNDIARDINDALRETQSPVRVMGEDIKAATPEIDNMRSAAYKLLEVYQTMKEEDRTDMTAEEKQLEKEVKELAGKVADAINRHHTEDMDQPEWTADDVLATLDSFIKRVVPKNLKVDEDMPELQAVINGIRDWYRTAYTWLDEAGMRKENVGFFENYVNHVWDKKRSDPDSYEEFVVNRQPTTSRNMKQRQVRTYMEGIEAGLVPQFTDITDMMGDYSKKNILAWANKKMLKDLSFIDVVERNEDGEVSAIFPMMSSVSPGLYGLDKYEYYEVPGVGTLWVYKDASKNFSQIFEQYKVGKAMRIYDNMASMAKKIELSWSGFHAGALSEVYAVQNSIEFGPKKTAQYFYKYLIKDCLESGLSPAYSNPDDYRSAAKHFVKLGATDDYSAPAVQNMSDTMVNFINETRQAMKEKGLLGKAAAGGVKPVEVMATAIKLINEGSDKILWTWLHDGLKIATFKMMEDRTNAAMEARFLKKHPEMSLEDIHKLKEFQTELNKQLDRDGQYVNDMFGGQHWELINISPKTLRYMRRLLLSPDWLISTQRHFLGSFGYGDIHSKARLRDFSKFLSAIKGEKAEFDENSLPGLYAGLIGKGAKAVGMSGENIDAWAEMELPHGRMRRALSSILCYAIGCNIFYDIANNLVNAIMRKWDEEDEERKEKENQGYVSKYKLMYPDGMKWFDRKRLDWNPMHMFGVTNYVFGDYGMQGNALGKKTHVFGGHYDEGAEVYLRTGKQFKEFPDFWENEKGELEFPRPLVNRLMGKANPNIRMIYNLLNYYTRWDKAYDDKQLEERIKKFSDNKTFIGVTAGMTKLAENYVPFWVPTQNGKNWIASDMVFPSSKGFSPHKAREFFEQFMRAQDEQGYMETVRACVMNGMTDDQIDKAIKSAKNAIQSEINKRNMEGTETLQEIMERFNATTDLSTRKKLNNKIRIELGNQVEKAPKTYDEFQQWYQNYLEGADEGAVKANEKYIERAEATDMVEEARISQLSKRIKEVINEINTMRDDGATDVEIQAFIRKPENKQMLAAQEIVKAYRNGETGYNAIKKQLGQPAVDVDGEKHDDKWRMQKIRSMRKEMIGKIEKITRLQ